MLILLADKSEYGWKTVSEYLDNELAKGEEDANGSLTRQEMLRKLAPIIVGVFLVATRFFQWWTNMGVSVFGAISTISTIELIRTPTSTAAQLERNQGFVSRVAKLAIRTANAL